MLIFLTFWRTQSSDHWPDAQMMTQPSPWSFISCCFHSFHFNFEVSLHLSCQQFGFIHFGSAQLERNIIENKHFNRINRFSMFWCSFLYFISFTWCEMKSILIQHRIEKNFKNHFIYGNSKCSHWKSTLHSCDAHSRNNDFIHYGREGKEKVQSNLAIYTHSLRSVHSQAIAIVWQNVKTFDCVVWILHCILS